jgi:hypothetical protein
VAFAPRSGVPINVAPHHCDGRAGNKIRSPGSDQRSANMNRTLRFLAAGFVCGLMGLSNDAIAGSAPVQISYVKPKDPAHQPIYRALRDRKILEAIKRRVQRWNLPRSITIKVEGCDGDINAAYEPSDRTLTICYEYLAYIQELAADIPEAGTRLGLTPKNYVVGPFLEVVLHELAHAVFDLKKVPLLGREEDAADQVAAYALLQLGPDEAKKTIASIAVMYAGEAKDAPPKLKDFSDEHGLPAQRFFNLLCMSYGHDPKVFGFVVEQGYLPRDRAEQCAGEYKQVDYAMKKLILPKGFKGQRAGVKTR